MLHDGDAVSFKIMTAFWRPDAQQLGVSASSVGVDGQHAPLPEAQVPAGGRFVRGPCGTSTSGSCSGTVWGFTTKGPDGRPSACPHQGIVEAYDLAIRENFALLMPGGRTSRWLGVRSTWVSTLAQKPRTIPRQSRYTNTSRGWRCGHHCIWVFSSTHLPIGLLWPASCRS